jgi:ferrous iron transport protein B
MAAEVNPITEKGVQLASGISLLFCFCLAMCQYDRDNEKRNQLLKWLGQLILMSAFAYIVALIAYQILK